MNVGPLRPGRHVADQLLLVGVTPARAAACVIAEAAAAGIQYQKRDGDEDQASERTRSTERTGTESPRHFVVRTELRVVEEVPPAEMEQDYSN